MLKVVQEQSQPNEHAPAAVGGSLLDELVRDGARQMLAAALLAEVAAYVDAHAHLVDEEGHRLVVRNGHHQPREVATAAGAVPVRQPRVNDRRIDEVTGSGDVSPRRSCRPGQGSPRAWPRCCRCCTCTACPAVTSFPPWSSSSARPPVCPRRPSPGSPPSGKTTRRRSPTGR